MRAETAKLAQKIHSVLRNKFKENVKENKEQIIK